MPVAYVAHDDNVKRAPKQLREANPPPGSYVVEGRGDKAVDVGSPHCGARDAERGGGGGGGGRRPPPAPLPEGEPEKKKWEIAHVLGRGRCCSFRPPAPSVLCCS